MIESKLLPGSEARLEDDLPLLDAEMPELGGSAEPGRWLDQNRRTLLHYQALVRTAVTLDALLDAEQELP